MIEPPLTKDKRPVSSPPFCNIAPSRSLGKIGLFLGLQIQSRNHFPRSRSVAKFKPTALRVESLESRQMMAGDVTAYMSGADLYLTEAAGQTGRENSVIISQ